MEKQILINQLLIFAKEGGDRFYDSVYKRPGFRGGRGDRLLAGALAQYFSGPEIPKDSLGYSWTVHLHKYMADAFVEFRTSGKFGDLRKAFLDETGEEVPDMVQSHIGGLYRCLVTHGMAYMMAVMTGEDWVRDELESYFDTQPNAINQAWHAFVRTGYRQLMPLIKEDQGRGRKGKFGKTTLMTYAMAGRVMFTFESASGSVSYVADESDMYGQRSGANASSVPYLQCVSMINEVTANWDLKKMKEDKKVGFGF